MVVVEVVAAVLVVVVGALVVVEVLVVVVVDVEVVPVVVLGVGTGTRTVARKRLFIVSGGSAQSTSWMRLAYTVIRQTVPGASVRLGVSVNLDAGERLDENLSACPLGHANLNDRRVARTRSLKRTVSTPPDAIDTERTRGARSAEAEGMKAFNHEAPVAAVTPAASKSGAASATATTVPQLLRTENPFGNDGTSLKPGPDEARGQT